MDFSTQLFALIEHMHCKHLSAATFQAMVLGFRKFTVALVGFVVVLSVLSLIPLEVGESSLLSHRAGCWGLFEFVQFPAALHQLMPL